MSYPAIEAVLFDKDGTLLDFTATWAGVYRHAATNVANGDEALAAQLLQAGGMDPDSGEFATESVLACETTPIIARLWAEVAQRDDPVELGRQLEQLFRTLEVRKLAPVPQLPAALAELRERGIKLGVATMDSEAMAHADLHGMGVHEMFSFVCGADSGYGAKPEPGMVWAFCQAVDVAPGVVAMVGDTPHDLNMGRNAGAGLVVGVLTGAGSGKSLSRHADHVIAGVADLGELLNG
jgi:phosphoglycolate phosphatase